VKERLTGAIIVVAALVLLVPELLTGPSWHQAQPAGTEGNQQLRSYTIDLQDDATRRPPPPSAPSTAVSDDPVGQATPETEGESPAVANVAPPADEATRASGKPMGSGADTSAATTAGQPATATARPDGATRADNAAKADSASKTDGPGSTTTAPGPGDDKPRSAFGPGADAARAAAGKAEAAKAAAAKAEAAKADAARAATAKADALKADAAKADAARTETAKAEAARLAEKASAKSRAESAKSKADTSDAPRLAAAKPEKGGAKGWAVQLGVFGSRDNAERLAKQVKGNGYPVVVSETSGKDGKKLYWVRVGPEGEQSAATAVSAKLKAAGHKDARVVAYP
jgi:cell division septation protein DedD